MHWQQGNDIESEGEKLSSSAECRIRNQGLWNRISSRPNVRKQTTCINQAKKADKFNHSLTLQFVEIPVTVEDQAMVIYP